MTVGQNMALGRVNNDAGADALSLPLLWLGCALTEKTAEEGIVEKWITLHFNSAAGSYIDHCRRRILNQRCQGWDLVAGHHCLRCGGQGGVKENREGGKN